MNIKEKKYEKTRTKTIAITTTIMIIIITLINVADHRKLVIFMF